MGESGEVWILSECIVYACIYVTVYGIRQRTSVIYAYKHIVWRCLVYSLILFYVGSSVQWYCKYCYSTIHTLSIPYTEQQLKEF